MTDLIARGNRPTIREICLFLYHFCLSKANLTTRTTIKPEQLSGNQTFLSLRPLLFELFGSFKSFGSSNEHYVLVFFVVVTKSKFFMTINDNFLFWEVFLLAICCISAAFFIFGDLYL